MTSENVTISKREYSQLKRKAEIDEELLHDLVRGLQDVLEGRVKRVR